MIHEVASIRVKPGTGPAFEKAVAEAVEVFRKAEGCKGLHLHHCIEEPDRYEVVIRWTTVEAHTETFRNGPLFQEWRALVGPHFAEPPVVHHHDIAMEPVLF